MMVNIDPAKDLAELIAAGQPQANRGMHYGQGTILSWNSTTFENTIDFRGVVLRNVPLSDKIAGLSLKVGDIVGLMGWAPGGGFGSWWIMGELGVPPLSEPVAIEGGASLIVKDGGSIILEGVSDDSKGNLIVSGGDIIVNDGDVEINDGGDVNINDGGNLFVNGGGDVEINDGGDLLVHDGGSIVIEDAGRWESHYGDGTVSAAMGPIWDPGLTVITDDGILVQDNNAGGNLDIFRALRDRATGNKDIFIGQGSGNPVDEFSVNADLLILNRTTGAGVVVSTATTTDPANMRVVGNLQPMLRVTSAARYKVDITDLVIDPRSVLKLRPRVWRDAGQVEEDPDMDRWTVGFVAEEVAEAGLTPFVDYDSDDNPESVAYDRLAVALLAVVQDQEARLQSLEERMAALDGQQALAVAVQPTELPKRRFDPPVQMSEISRDRER
jgi:hypothetical protein